MSRLLGVVSLNVSSFDTWLLSAPKSLVGLGAVEPEGWGAAVFDRSKERWTIERHASTTARQPFESVARRMRGEVLVAHTGPTRDAKQPLVRDPWVFAHDGSDSDGVDVFARLLVALGAGRSDLDLLVARAAEPAMGFVLSDGVHLYANRAKSSLYLAERAGPDPTLAVASEPLTTDPWFRLAEGTLLRCDRSAGMETVFLRGRDPRPVMSESELPFTD